MIQLSFIILSFNTKDLTLGCLASIIENFRDELKAGLFEIILMDNNSSDGTVAEIKKHYSEKFLHIIKNAENTGFSKGNNIAASCAHGEYLLFLNSDALLKDSGIIHMLSYAREHPQISIMGGRLKNQDGSYQPSAGVFYTLFRVFLLLIGVERKGMLRFSPSNIIEVDWVSGAMMMVKKAEFEKIGGFDEHLFMYMEDMELCFRMKKKGKEIVFYPQATIEHLSHGSSNRSFAITQIYKGLLYFYKKHMNRLQYLLVKVLLITKAYLIIFLGMITGNDYYIDTYKNALKHI